MMTYRSPNLPDCASEPIPDVQGSQDNRQMAIDRVGIKDLRHPIQVQDSNGQCVNTIANINMYVDLPKQLKGTHMSRFVEILNAYDTAFSLDTFGSLLKQQTQRLQSQYARIELRFPFFIEKTAPISKLKSLLDYSVEWIGEYRDGQTSLNIKIIVPVTSLCPCSKKISNYGAHNQRSHVTITANISETVGIYELIELVEAEAPCQLWAGLKRADEKYVTEYAYDHAKFVEDMVRDIATKLDNDKRIQSFTLESENFESIHNHSAYAMIERTK